MPQKDRLEYNEYMNRYMQERYTERMSTAIAKLGGKCVRCPTVSNLQLDHINPATKSFTIGKLWSIAKETFLNELTKCQLLCVDCHIEKTRIEQNQDDARKVHGTLSSYRYCRCELCRKAHSNYCKEYRKSHPRKKMTI